MQKYEVVDHLAGHFGFETYLEICTPTTGKTFNHTIAGDRFRTHHRLIYLCHDGFDDGAPITFRTSGPCSDQIVSRLLAESGGQPIYDLVFVDPWHTFTCSFLDLFGAWLLLKPGGALVVHDCDPPSREIAAPRAPKEGGDWCGVTYQAFVDLVLTGVPARFFTVDCDYGVGVALKRRLTDTPAAAEEQARNKARRLAWNQVRRDDRKRIDHFLENRQALLNLVAPAEFRDSFWDKAAAG